MTISRSLFNRIPSVRDSRSRDGDGRVDHVADLDNVMAPVASGGLLFQPLSHGTGTPTALAIFACEQAGGLGAMDSVKQTHIVPMPNQNMLDDDLRTSFGELTLPILSVGTRGGSLQLQRRHSTGNAIGL